MRYFLLSVTILISSFKINAQSFSWAKRLGGTNASTSTPYWDRGIAVDGSQNVYTLSNISGAVDADSGPGIVSLNSANGEYIVQKLDATGAFVWAKQFRQHVRSIGIDNAGNVFLTGSFQTTADFDPGDGVFNLTSFGSNDVYVLKLDNAGNFIWAKQAGGGASETGSYIAVSASGVVYVTGVFGGTADFDPDPVNTYNLVSSGSDGFLLALNNDGNFLWVRQKDTGLDQLTTDVNGNIIYTGATSPYNWYIEKIDAANNLLWTTNLNYGFQIFSLAADNNENVLYSGNFSGTVDFDPGPGVKTFTASTNQDGFNAKLNANGSFAWATHIRANGTANSIAADANGNVYTTGNCGANGNIDFDPGPGTFTLKGTTRAMYIQKLNAAGGFIWVKQVAGDTKSRTWGRGIALTSTGNIYTNIEFSGTIDIDPGAAKVTLTSIGTQDKVIHKMMQPNTGLRQVYVEADKKEELIISIYAANRFMVKLPGVNENVTLTIYDMSGRVISKKNVYAGTQQTVDLPAIKGVYTMEAKYKDRVLIKRIPVQQQARFNLL